MTRGDRARPSALLRSLLRVPVLCYRLGFARMLGPHLLLLTTTGRRTGRPRTFGLNYAREGEVLYVISGWGPHADWYRNLITEPRAGVQVGERTWAARAGPVTDPERRARAIRLLRVGARRQGSPKLLRPAFRAMGLDYEAEVRTLDGKANEMPIVVLTTLPEPAR